MKRSLILTLILTFCSILPGQNIEKKIDEIFHEWNQGSHPGGVVSIVDKSGHLFSKAYGQANIKYKVPNTTETIFNIGSVSKQFTAMGIVLLQQQGKLSFDDDIRKYLPELHNFETPISIRHLLHHTSGFRSTPELFGLAGWRDGDPISTEDDYQYFCKQTQLNFTPGSQFMYSNSGYILLAQIITRISSQDFHTWMQENIFTPLQMHHTFVDETNSNTNPKVASPYYGLEEQEFTFGENTSLDIGASNIYTNAGDLTKWMKNFKTPSKGWEQAFELLQTTDPLSNGKVNEYAFGVIKDDFFGNKRIQHTGGVPGFLSYAMYYPEEDLLIILLTNFTSYSVNEKYMMLSQLFLADKTPKNEIPTPIKEISLDKEAAKNLVGDYWNSAENYPRRIYLDQDTLWYLRDSGSQSPLIQTGANQFVIGGIKAQVRVSFEEGAKNSMIVSDSGNPPQFFEEYDSSPLTEKEKEAYTGTFYSPELETRYTISCENKQLMGYHSRHGAFPIEVLKKDVCNWSGMAVVSYARNAQKEITGFYVSLNRVKNVWFQKTEE